MWSFWAADERAHSNPPHSNLIIRTIVAHALWPHLTRAHAAREQPAEEKEHAQPDGTQLVGESGRLGLWHVRGGC